MSWLFGNAYKKTVPTHTNLQLQKTKQIETLKQINAVVVEVVRDIEYRVTFPVSTVNYTLTINLPPQFPQVKPTVSVEPLLCHPWVDNLMNVSLCPALIAFSMHSSLGVAVQSIIDEFRANPPQLITPHLPTQAVSSSAIPRPNYGMPQSVFLPPSSSIQPPPIPSYPQAAVSTTNSVSTSNIQDSIPYFYTMPSLPTSFQQLSNKTSAELNTLLQDDDKLQELLNDQPELKKITDDKESVSKNCVDLATANLAMKPQIESLKKSLHADITRLGGLQSSIDAERITYTELSQQYTLSHILSNLKVAILEAEEESEKVAESFLANKIVMDKFCKDFLEKRALCHSRRAKEEKLQQIMASQGHGY